MRRVVVLAAASIIILALPPHLLGGEGHDAGPPPVDAVIVPEDVIPEGAVGELRAILVSAPVGGDRPWTAPGSANRDATVFRDPDRLDVGRAENKHPGFGQGTHYCLGEPLARLEARVAFETLLRRMPDLRPKAPPGSLRWRRSLILRGLEALPVRY